MNSISKDCGVISLFYENAESKIVNDYFIESSIGDGLKSIGKGIAKTIRGLIAALESFFKSLKERLRGKQVEESLRKLKKAGKAQIKVKINDKEVRKFYKKGFDIYERYLKALRKLHDQFSAGKIDYAQFVVKLDELSLAIEKETNALEEGLSESLRNAPEKFLSADEVAATFGGMLKYEEELMQKIEKTSTDYQKQLANEAEKVDAVMDRSDDSEKNGLLRKLGHVKTQVASKISSAAHKITGTIQKHPIASTLVAVATAAVVVGGGALYANKNPDLVRAHQQNAEMKKAERTTAKQMQRAAKNMAKDIKKGKYTESADYDFLMDEILGNTGTSFEESGENSAISDFEAIMAEFEESAEDEYTGEDYFADDDFDADDLFSGIV